jgi:hypothetical protein
MKPGLNDELCGQAWTEQDVSGLQDELAKRLGYLIVDWSRPSLREGERIAMKIHRETCIERKWPLVVVYIGLHYCTVQIDTDPMQRPKEERQGGLTVEEQADIDTLMAPYRREWADSPVLRRYGRVPHRDAHVVAQRIFELAGGNPVLAAECPSRPVSACAASLTGIHSVARDLLIYFAHSQKYV